MIQVSDIGPSWPFCLKMMLKELDDTAEKTNIITLSLAAEVNGSSRVKRGLCMPRTYCTFLHFSRYIYKNTICTHPR